MNKFLRHKLQRIRDLQEKLITAHTSQSVHLGDLFFANNRRMNYVLKLLRSLPAELLISNNPDIAQALAEAAQHCNLDALAKTNINQQYGGLSPSKVVVSHLFSPDTHAGLTGTCQEALKATLVDLSDSVNEIAKLDPSAAAASLDVYLQKQLETRKEHKRQYIALSHKAKELCVSRIKELTKVNPKLQKQLLALMRLRREITITFMESDSRPITGFFNEWVRLIHQQ